MAKIAITDGMAEDAVLMLRKEGHEVDLLTSSSNLTGYDYFNSNKDNSTGFWIECLLWGESHSTKCRSSYP